MHRSIVRFHLDDEGDWVADLSCAHGQHVRHQPPLRDRYWVTTAEGRVSRIGSLLNCVECDRGVLPGGLTRRSRTSVFGEHSIPDALTSPQRTPAHTWARLEVSQGAVRVVLDTATKVDRLVTPDDSFGVPPGVDFRVEAAGPVRFRIEYLALDT